MTNVLKKTGSGQQYSEDMLRFAVEATPNGMVMTDQQGIIVLVNAEIEKLFGYSRDELIGKSIEMLVPDRFRSGHPQHRDRYFHNPQSRAMGHGRDLHGVHKNGSEIPLEIGLNPVTNDEGVFVLASVVDITERKTQEQQLLAALKEKELMLAEIHHRVKNNLQIIDSLLGMQSDTLDDERLIAALRESQNRVKSMSLIHQTLYESRDFSRVNMAEVLRSLADNLLVSYAIDTDLIQVRFDLEEVYLPINTSIPLSLMVNEICSNALKHAFPSAGSGVLVVSLRALDNDWLQLIVADDGVGIPEDFDIEAAASLGLQLIQLLSEQISAELMIQRSKPTRFLLKIPVPVNSSTS